MSDPVLRTVVLLQVLRADLRLGHCQQKKESGRTEEQNRQQLRVERLLYWEDGSQLRGSQLRTTSNLGKKPGEPFHKSRIRVIIGSGNVFTSRRLRKVTAEAFL